MSHRFAWILGIALCCIGRAHAQSLPAIVSFDNTVAAQETKVGSDATAPIQSTSKGDAPTTPIAFFNSSAANRVWGQADYLLWRVKSAPAPIPIVTTGDPTVGFDPTGIATVNTAGAIGSSGTHVLFGNDNIKYPALSGVRLTLGGWIDVDRRLGVEGSGFALERATNSFIASSNSVGSPPLYFPIFSALADAERGIPISDPLRKFSGDVSVNSTLRFAGGEGNALCDFYRGSDASITLLIGFRYADLRESLRIHNTTRDLIFGNTQVINDSFQTVNQFYGGQLGGRFFIERDWLSLSVTGKIAAGSMHQVANVQGEITQLGPNPLVPPGLGTFPGGMFAQPTNMGNTSANPVSVPVGLLPSLEMKLGARVTQNFRAFAGYDIMYWSQVVRPGNTMNHVVNLSQNAVLDPSGTGTLTGPAQPSLLLQRSEFWAQGISFGLEVSY